MENVDELNHSIISGAPCYRLSNSNVFVSAGGLNHTKYLDKAETPSNVSEIINEQKISDTEISYIESQLQSNSERFDNQVRVVQKHVTRSNPRLLDIGCGGGLFLAKIGGNGYMVTGLELSDTRAYYAKMKYNLEIIKEPIESEYWSAYQENYDVVTLWDVIEHVNYPQATLKSVIDILKKGGFLFIDTPFRDSFYHRAGELSYRISNGRFPLFLNAMYSDHPFGHKQIFATYELKYLLEKLNFEVVDLQKFHELSFPYICYLRKLLKLEIFAKFVLPFVGLFLFVFPVKDKMLIIARKR